MTGNDEPKESLAVTPSVDCSLITLTTGVEWALRFLKLR